MPALQCNFTIPVNGRGGKCTGNFTGDPLASGSSFPIQVTCTGLGQDRAPSLSAVFIVSAGRNNRNQANPTPFRTGADTNSGFMCYWSAPAQAATNQNGQATYTFSSPTYYGGAQGKYELTVVFQTDAGQQYSDDPEFDTGV
jgi:hypothetical protein